MIIDYLEDELSEEEYLKAKTHIAACEMCAEKVREYQATFSVLSKDVVPPVPSVKWANFLPNIYEELEKPTLWEKIQNALKLVFSPGKALAYGVMLALLITVVLTISKYNPDDKMLDMEQILAQNEDSIQEVEYLIEDEYTPLEDEFDWGSLSDTDLESITDSYYSSTETADISDYIDESIYEKVDSMNDIIYEQMSFEEILENLTDEEAEKIIIELEKSLNNKNSV
jgi:hypothetical protein